MRTSVALGILSRKQGIEMHLTYIGNRNVSFRLGGNWRVTSYTFSVRKIRIK